MKYFQTNSSSNCVVCNTSITEDIYVTPILHLFICHTMLELCGDTLEYRYGIYEHGDFSKTEHRVPVLH